jgi:hypothetical protein
MNDDRASRIQAICDAAKTRSALGQTAGHVLLDDGRHRISLFAHTAGVLREWTGATLAEAIQKAQEAIR